MAKNTGFHPGPSTSGSCGPGPGSLWLCFLLPRHCSWKEVCAFNSLPDQSAPGRVEGERKMGITQVQFPWLHQGLLSLDKQKPGPQKPPCWCQGEVGMVRRLAKLTCVVVSGSADKVQLIRQDALHPSSDPCSLPAAKWPFFLEANALKVICDEALGLKIYPKAQYGSWA